MNRDEIRARLADIVNSVVKEPVDPATVEDATRLQEDLGVGSIEVSDMAFTVEDVFDIEFKDEEVLPLTRPGTTVGDVINIIEKKMSGAG